MFWRNHAQSLFLLASMLHRVVCETPASSLVQTHQLSLCWLVGRTAAHHSALLCPAETASQHMTSPSSRALAASLTSSQGRLAASPPVSAKRCPNLAHVQGHALRHAVLIVAAFRAPTGRFSTRPFAISSPVQARGMHTSNITGRSGCKILFTHYRGSLEDFVGHLMMSIARGAYGQCLVISIRRAQPSWPQ